MFENNELIQQMQQAIIESKKRLESVIVSGESGGGLMRIEMNGNRKLISLKINTSLKEMEKDYLEDLLSVALVRALEEAEKIHEKETAASTMQFLPRM